MSDFDFTPLEDGEEIVFGIATSSGSSSHRVVENGLVIEHSSSASERRSGVTNRRVIIEASGRPDATQIIPNADVRRVFLKRDKFMGEPRLELTALETTAGENMELGIGFLEASDELLLRTTFPNAEVVETAEARESNGHEEPKKKGLLGFFGFGP